jgi:hypothetical protein
VNRFKVAAQVYVGVLSYPQLYQEGNHRTGSLIASGILLQSGCPPFVLTRRNAIAYFNPSADIKFTNKRTVRGVLRLPKYRRQFRDFLRHNVSASLSVVPRLWELFTGTKDSTLITITARQDSSNASFMDIRLLGAHASPEDVRNHRTAVEIATQYFDAKLHTGDQNAWRKSSLGTGVAIESLSGPGARR